MNTQAYVTGLGHIGIPTKDIAGTIRFYESLGFTLVHETMNPQTGEKVVFLWLAGVTVETYESAEVAGCNGGVDHLALAVDDIETAFKQAVEEGYHLLDNEIQFMPFWEKGTRFFTLLGPNHEKIEFAQIL